ncbi:hypothetical protein NQ315_003520, partial [Exocentrus adspersus]
YNKKTCTQSEKVDMLLIFGKCHKNSRNAAELYVQRYSNGQHPVHQYFPYLENRFRQDGNRNAEETKIAQELQITHDSATKIRKKHGYQAFIRFYQHLYADDGDRRVMFCDWLLQNHRGDPNFINFILFSEESRFTNN